MLNCRFCNAPLEHTLVDLGVQPLANSYVELEREQEMEPFFPLHVRTCARCLLVQLPELASPEHIFSDYAYLSSTSSSWLEHAKRFVGWAIERFELKPSDLAVEVASNDGYLLRFFVERGHQVLGIEPAANVAAIAEQAGVFTISRFFGTALARELRDAGKRAKILIGNNVLAHVPDINDFVAGLALLLADDGVLSMEFPHLQRLLELNQFDTIYHEHFSYLSLLAVRRIFEQHGLRVFGVEELPTHGGSLRVLACPVSAARPVEDSVERVLAGERGFGLERIETYTGFAARVEALKFELLEFLIDQKRAGKKVVGYGAPAKGNTLLNYCGIRTDLLAYTVDRNPLKQDKLLPGTRIPIHGPEAITRDKPDFVLILPWNLEAEVVQQMAEVRSWGGRFLVPVPSLRVV
jgi:SAM-dependent methyltransferase